MVSFKIPILETRVRFPGSAPFSHPVFLVGAHNSNIILVLSCLAAAGVLWCIFWVALAYEKPDHHPKISETEQAYIRKGRPIQPNLTSVSILNTNIITISLIILAQRVISRRFN